MRKMSNGFICLTTAAALVISACDGAPTGVNSGDELGSAEVAAVLGALSAAFDVVGAGAVPAPAAAPALTPQSFDESFNETFQCESGSIGISGSVSGTVDDETFDMNISTEVNWQPNACVVGDEVNTFTIDGDIELTLDMVSEGEMLSLSGTEVGGFSYTSSDAREGSCEINVTYSIVTGQEPSITGTVCGLDASGFDTLGS